MSNLYTILDKLREISETTRDQGTKFEQLIQGYLKTDPKYNEFKEIYMWSEFPYREEFGGQDVGIDLVAITDDDEYCAIQCKFFAEDNTIDKAGVDTFLSTSGRTFNNGIKFSRRLWVATTNKWTSNAEETLRNQTPEVNRIRLSDLESAEVDWDKLYNGLYGKQALNPKKIMFDHQEIAVRNTHEYFKSWDKGKLIMACGTGKTFTSLNIAEKETNGKGLILFLVPSIALLGQTLNEWSAQASDPLHAICICSDPKISSKKGEVADGVGISTIDLALPASTHIPTIVHRIKKAMSHDTGMTVVFSTYQSIAVISEAQKELKKTMNIDFDLIICDEAHRTTGVTLLNEDESHFVKVHDNDFIVAKKRLYMTATPRLYSEDSKTKAQIGNHELCSMDDETIYGEEIYRIGFGEAVEKGLLSDYKVLILTMSDASFPRALQNAIANAEDEITTDDASKLVGCINALSKNILVENDILKKEDPEPMNRAVAFCQSIKISKGITSTFNNSTELYYDKLPAAIKNNLVEVHSDHIDGSMNAVTRDDKLRWLKEPTGNPNECRILTNVRCLSEGVDVPSLDAVLFLSARNSQVDVVQSVGRVMRKAEGKKYGYIIIPIFVPSDVEPEKALSDNKRYAVVWTVLNALRAHDDRFNAIINKLELNKSRDSRILIGGIAGDPDDKTQESVDITLTIPFQEYQEAIYAKLVEKVGDRRYWEQWAKDVANIATRYIERINTLIKNEGEHKTAFEEFLKGLKSNINPTITEESAIEMLAQHIITQPVFDALFENYSFAKNNVVSQSMSKMIKLLEEQAFDKDLQSLEAFYASVKKRAEGIDNAEGKQKIIIELYDKFFKSAFPKMVEQLGIVYTPLPCVDFVINSMEEILQQEFGRSLSDENVHILDPFTGTGTFMVRLMKSLDPKKLLYKYQNELHANEIVLLAYYIASVNIENTFHDITGRNYESFEGICLTDTFQLGEDPLAELPYNTFPENTARLKKQKSSPIRVIMANPPYSMGQKSANDNNQNTHYQKLNQRITDTYTNNSTAGLNKSSYDSYIKAFRWATDRLGEEGLVSFVTGAGWVDGNAADGFRKSLETEYSKIYVFNLRGDQRTKGEKSREEGGKIFGGGSRTPIAITFLIRKKDHDATKKAEIFYHDIGDYLNRDKKLQIISDYAHINNITWDKIIPNEHGDWISQRGKAFGSYTPLTPDKKFNLLSKSFFTVNAIGLASNRDPYVYNFSKDEVSKNMSAMISFYNDLVKEFKVEKTNNSNALPNYEHNESEIKWTVNLKKDLERCTTFDHDERYIVTSMYRPFCKQYLYSDRNMIERPGLSSQIFPSPQHENKVICVGGVGSTTEFSVFITDTIPNLDLLVHNQTFPLHYYENADKTLYSDDIGGKKSAISSYIITEAKQLYGEGVTDEDIFYYVYGVLHSTGYRTKYAADLKRSLPHIPLLTKELFLAFSESGRKLADLHLNYEEYTSREQASIPEVVVMGDEHNNFTVQKMRFISKDQKDTIQFNSHITISNIPEKAYQYMVNGRSAIEWVMERYQIKTHKETNITNNPNLWCDEHNNPRYILDLLLSVISLSVQTVDIVNALPIVEWK